MTRKDYVKVAEIIRRARQRENLGTLPPVNDGWLEDEFIELFAADNPRFDRRRFELACAMEGKKND